MDAGAEGNVVVRPAREVELLGRDVGGRIHVGGRQHGHDLIAAFEQEFVYTGNEERPGDAYSLGAFRRQGTFGESFVAAMRAAGVVPDCFLAEYGARQFEVTVAPAAALTAADHAVIEVEVKRRGVRGWQRAARLSAGSCAYEYASRRPVSGVEVAL